MDTKVYLNALAALALTANLSFGISLDDAVAQAVAHNRQIRISGTKIEQRRSELSAQQTRRLPSTSVQATGGILLTRADVTFPAGSFGNGNNGPVPDRDTQIGIPRRFSGFSYSSVGLPLTGQIRIGHGIEGARLEVQVAETDRARTEQEVVAQVRQLYFNLVSADAALRAAQANLELAREVERLAGQGVEAGTTLPADRGEAVARRVRSEAVVSGVRADRENICEHFNLLLGRNLDEPVEVSAPDVLPPDGSADQLRDRAAANRPEVESARLRIRQAETAVKAKKAELIPDVNLAFQHIGFLNSGNLVPSNYAIAGLQLTWEPWDWGRRRKEARALQSQADAAKIALEETQQQVRRQASQALRAWEQSQREIAAAEAAVTAAQESVRIQRQRFEQQAALMRSLLEAQSTFESAQEQHVRAIAARGTAWASLQLAVGNK